MSEEKWIEFAAENHDDFSAAMPHGERPHSEMVSHHSTIANMHRSLAGKGGDSKTNHQMAATAHEHASGLHAIAMKHSAVSDEAFRGSTIANHLSRIAVVK